MYPLWSEAGRDFDGPPDRVATPDNPAVAVHYYPVTRTGSAHATERLRRAPPPASVSFPLLPLPFILCGATGTQACSRPSKARSWRSLSLPGIANFLVHRSPQPSSRWNRQLTRVFQCKRLKLKCDRRTPCSSCIKRDTVQRCVYSQAAAEKV